MHGGNQHWHLLRENKEDSTQLSAVGKRSLPTERIRTGGERDSVEWLDREANSLVGDRTNED